MAKQSGKELGVRGYGISDFFSKDVKLGIISIVKSLEFVVQGKVN